MRKMWRFHVVVLQTPQQLGNVQSFFFKKNAPLFCVLKNL